jgi:hypothetical protein
LSASFGTIKEFSSLLMQVSNMKTISTMLRASIATRNGKMSQYETANNSQVLCDNLQALWNENDVLLLHVWRILKGIKFEDFSSILSSKYFVPSHLTRLLICTQL